MALYTSIKIRKWGFQLCVDLQLIRIYIYASSTFTVLKSTFYTSLLCGLFYHSFIIYSMQKIQKSQNMLTFKGSVLSIKEEDFSSFDTKYKINI